MTVIDPSGSSNGSSYVGTEYCTEPPVGMVTQCQLGRPGIW